MESKIIRACCPNCGTYPKDDMIHYQNSGPIVRIFCRNCGLIVNDLEAWGNGYQDVIDYWNKISVYMPQDY